MKKLFKKIKPVFILLDVYFILFITFLIMGFVGNHAVRQAAAVLLALLGCAAIITGIVFYRIYKHNARYTCPVCGATRDKHSQYITSWEEDSSKTEPSQKVLYHQYRYTYVCPICGDTREEIKKENGGLYRVFSSGKIIDDRKPPHTDY